MSTFREKDRAVTISLLSELQSENTSLRFQVEKLTLALRHASSGGGLSAGSEEVKRLHAELQEERARRERLEQQLNSINKHRQPPSMVSMSTIETEIENLQKRLTETRLAMRPPVPPSSLSHLANSLQPQESAPVMEAAADRDDLTLIIRHLNEKKAGHSGHHPWRPQDDDEIDRDGWGGHARDSRDQESSRPRRRGGSKSSNVDRLFAGLPTRGTLNDQGRRRR